MNYRPLLLALSSVFPLQAQVLITQYYEGTSFNKFLEITNTGDSEADLSTYTLARFINDGAEDWKTGGGPNAIEQLSGTLAAGASFVLANGSATVPFDADQANLISSIITFNGNDSMVLYEGVDEFNNPVTTVANIVDAFSVTDGAQNISVIRKTSGQGFDLNAGTTYADYPVVWETLDLDTVNTASLGEDAYIGSSALGLVSPLVSFAVSSAAVAEDSGTVDLVVRIDNPDGQEVSVDLVFDAGISTVGVDEIGGYTTQTVTFVAGAASGDTQTVTVTLANDVDEEPTEQAIFNLENLQTDGDTILGGGTAFTLSILDDDTLVPPLYISEIADPSDNPSGRFIELYNPTDAEVDLAAGNWNIIVYFNGNTSSQSISLFGTIPAGGVYVVANNEANFAEAYPDAPTPAQYSGSINSNGNETFELRFGGGVDTGVVVDIYGMVGTDGVGQDFEFLDSQVARASTVTGPNATFTIGEWIITPGGISQMTPGTLDGGVPPVTGPPEIAGLSVNGATGEGEMVVSGLGGKAYNIEYSDDLNQLSPWAILVSGFTKFDNPDGSVTLSFTDSQVPSAVTRFYRLIEVQ